MSDLQFEQVANIKVFGIGGGGCRKRRVLGARQGVPGEPAGGKSSV